MTLRIGVLGASRIAELGVVKPARELGHRLVAVAARSQARAESFAEKYGVERVVGSYQDVIDDPEVDVVYNPLANSLHGPWNLAAIAAGKPVLTEKPSARNSSEAKSVADAAQAAGVVVLEAFHYYFHPVTQRTFTLLSDGALGRIERVEVRMGMPTPADDDPRWSFDMAGGALMDLGCYGLHVMRMLGGMSLPGVDGGPSISRATCEQRTPEVDAWCDVDVAFPGGATGLSANSMVADDYSFTMHVLGTEGELLVHDFLGPNRDDRLTLRTARGTTVERLGSRSTYTYQLEAFAARVLHGVSLPFGTEDAVANMALIDAAYDAAGMRRR